MFHYAIFRPCTRRNSPVDTRQLTVTKGGATIGGGGGGDEDHLKSILSMQVATSIGIMLTPRCRRHQPPPGPERRDECRDRNECAEGVRPCSQQCFNTFGGFRCSCNNGFLPRGEHEHSCVADPHVAREWTLGTRRRGGKGVDQGRLKCF